MDPVGAKFYDAPFEIEHSGQVLPMRGLISEQGITKIFMKGKLPDFLTDLLGEDVTVRLDRLILKGLFTRQFVEHGSFYEIRFKDIEEPQKAYIRQRINAEGINPGWQRKYPRIPVSGLQDNELPLPNLCMVRFVGQENFVNVINFTLGGLRIETMGDSLQEIRVGAIIHFDLITTTGEVMNNLSAEVRNMSVHEAPGRVTTRSLGLKFVEMDPVNERKYRALIRDFCLVLRKRFNEEDEE